MPFPPGVGGGRMVGDVNLDTYEVITADKAIDENNVGNRMLRNMGWQEGLVSFHSLCTYMSFYIYFCYQRCLAELDIVLCLHLQPAPAFENFYFWGCASDLILEVEYFSLSLKVSLILQFAPEARIGWDNLGHLVFSQRIF